jgi:hypothetical protein
MTAVTQYLIEGLHRNLNSEEKHSHEVLSVNECASVIDGLHPIALIWLLELHHREC